MKLKEVVSHLLFTFAAVLFLVQVNSLVIQKSTLKIAIDPLIGDDSGKGPPGIKTVDLGYLNATDRTITNDGASNYIISSAQMRKSSSNELKDFVENRTKFQNKKRNQRVDYKTYYPDIIIQKNENN